MNTLVPTKETVGVGEEAQEVHQEALGEVQPWMTSALIAIRKDIGQPIAPKSQSQRVVRSVKVAVSIVAREDTNELTALKKEEHTMPLINIVDGNLFHVADPHLEVAQGPQLLQSVTIDGVPRKVRSEIETVSTIASAIQW